MLQQNYPELAPEQTLVGETCEFNGIPGKGWNDGFTAYKRVKGKEFKKELVKFGECIWYLKPKSKGKAKAECRWEDGVFLGIRDESGEYIVGTPEGAIKVRSI